MSVTYCQQTSVRYFYDNGDNNDNGKNWLNGLCHGLTYN